MSDKLPRRPNEHIVGDQGARILQSSIPAAWIYRDLEGKGDYGIDGEIEIFEAGVPTGLSCRVQLRSHLVCQWNAEGEYVQPLPESTRNYWRLQTLPVVVVVCDVRSGSAYWAFADAAETPSGVRVSRENVLPHTAERLRLGLNERAKVTGPPSLLLMAPLMETYWHSLDETRGGDSFLPIEDDDLARLKLIYGQLPFLRYSLGLAPSSIVPWDVWVAKSTLGFSNCYEIYWAVFDEIIEYLRPVVDETLDVAASRLSSRSYVEGDVVARNWAERRLGRNVSYGHIGSFRGDRTFWEGFDSLLRARKVLRFSAVDAFDASRKARS